MLFRLVFQSALSTHLPWSALHNMSADVNAKIALVKHKQPIPTKNSKHFT